MWDVQFESPFSSDIIFPCDPGIIFQELGGLIDGTGLRVHQGPGFFAERMKRLDMLKPIFP